MKPKTLSCVVCVLLRSSQLDLCCCVSEWVCLVNCIVKQRIKELLCFIAYFVSPEMGMNMKRVKRKNLGPTCYYCSADLDILSWRLHGRKEGRGRDKGRSMWMRDSNKERDIQPYYRRNTFLNKMKVMILWDYVKELNKISQKPHNRIVTLTKHFCSPKKKITLYTLSICRMRHPCW